jgi:hypothetical protein
VAKQTIKLMMANYHPHRISLLPVQQQALEQLPLALTTPARWPWPARLD